jgi:hypothetical protein
MTALSPLSPYPALREKNQLVSNAIYEYVNQCNRTNDHRHRIAALKVSTALQNHPHPITNVQEGRSLPNVGEGFATFIIEAINGTVPAILAAKRNALYEQL